MENYQVVVNKPFSSRFVKGAGFGYNIAEIGADRFFYWDGNDYWIPTDTELTAIFKGTLKFYPNDSNLHPDFESEDYYPTPLNLIGDALVLSLWPQDYLKLNEVLPEGSPVPKTIVYQNVDRAACISAAKTLIMSNKEFYKPIFRQETENEISDDVLERRAQTWLNNDWSRGEGNGVLVQSGDALGKVSSERPTSTDEATNNSLVPAGSSGMGRLTLKSCGESGRYFNTSFLFYLLSNIDNDQLDQHREEGDAFLEEANSNIRSLPKFRVFYHNNAEQEIPESIPEDAVSVDSSTEAWISNDTITRKIPAVFDFFASDSHDYWRMQGWSPIGIYQIQCSPFFGGGRPPDSTYDGLTVTLGDDGQLEISPEDPFGFIDMRRRWLQFGSSHKYVLGINMETLRQNHFHDLSGNPLIVQRDDTSGDYTRQYTFDNAWLSQPSNVISLREDFNALRALGISCVRIWVFELLEGIEFNYLPLLDEERKQADLNLSAHFQTSIFPDFVDRSGRRSLRIIHACTKREFDQILSAWRSSLSHLSANSIRSASGRSLIDNAKILRDVAHDSGLKILWTLFTHYGEAYPQIGADITYPTLIYYCHNRIDSSGTITRPLVSAPQSDWANYYSHSITSGGDGRLQVEAWIYRAMIANDEIRSSVMSQIVTPFVREILSDNRDATFGFELMNESDIIWEGSAQLWTNFIKGGQSIRNELELDSRGNLKYKTELNDRGELEQVVNDDSSLTTLLTKWKLSRNQIRTFLVDCIGAIRSGGWTGFITSSVMGQNDHMTHNELSLLRPEGDGLSLNFSSISRYAIEQKWQDYFNVTISPGNSSTINPHRVTDFEGGTPNIHNHKLLFSEAGDLQCEDSRVRFTSDEAYYRTRQRNALKEALKAGIRLGYAGMLIWHYNNPSRTIWGTENNALTAYVGESGSITIGGNPTDFKPAAQEIRDFVTAYRSILL